MFALYLGNISYLILVARYHSLALKEREREAERERESEMLVHFILTNVLLSHDSRKSDR